MIIPQWPAPANISALCTTRNIADGSSRPPYDRLNLADHVGDDASTVFANRSLLIAEYPAFEQSCWLQQTHSTRVINSKDYVWQVEPPEGDATVSQQPGVACVVMTADCLPLLICHRQGYEVAAVHAGWRGLLNGIIENTLQAIQSPNDELLVWLGPAIGQQHFEVGDEVRQLFLQQWPAQLMPVIKKCFIPVSNKPKQYLADLVQLAKINLRYLGVEAIYGGDYCTYSDASRFYSYRRDGITGRMASLIVFRD